MAEVKVEKIKDPGKKEMSTLFADFAKRFDAVRQRAHELFENRGSQWGKELEDWITAEREVFGWTAAELSEKDNAFQVQFTLAGFDAKDVQVTAMPNEIIVRAAASDENKGEKENVLWSEFGSKSVFRRFELPSAIESDKVTAKLDKGILCIQAPKAAAPKVTTIPIAAAAA